MPCLPLKFSSLRVALRVLPALPAFLVLATAAPAAPLTSFKPGVLWLDTEGNRINAHGGGIYQENGTFYWFGEKRNKSASGGVSVYSSTDLYNWKYERLALALDSTLPIKPGCIIERPKVIHNPQTGKYMMWFHLEVAKAGYDSAFVGIAESDSVTGPYHFVDGYRPNGNMSRDQNMFVDDDGTPYHVYSSRDNYDMRLHTLTPDWRGAAVKDTLTMYNLHREAPALFKHNGKYHLITSGATGWDPNAATEHVASNIWGPWVARGNPAKGNGATSTTGASTTFGSQSTFVFKIPGYANAYVYMGDRWTPTGTDGVEGSFYIWLPLHVSNDSAIINWNADWTITGVFGQPTALLPHAQPGKNASSASVPGMNFLIRDGKYIRDLVGRRRGSISPPVLPAAD